MEEKIYTIELLHQGKYESWGFEDSVSRNEFYNKVREQFAGNEIVEENDDLSVVQLSANNLRIREDGEIAQKVPYVWFDGRLFREILEYINLEYKKSQQ